MWSKCVALKKSSKVFKISKKSNYGGLGEAALEDHMGPSRLSATPGKSGEIRDPWESENVSQHHDILFRIACGGDVIPNNLRRSQEEEDRRRLRPTSNHTLGLDRLLRELIAHYVTVAKKTKNK
jgi:hypothetical protein